MPPRKPPQAPSADDLALPPPYTLVAVGEAEEAFAHATGIAAEAGAGTLVLGTRSGLVDFALVLEPDEPLRTARRAFYAGMSALGDALATMAPPETAIVFEWPGAIFVNEGLVGGGRLAWPAGADENAPPPWLAFGITLRAYSTVRGEPGRNPLGTALAYEGFGDPSSGRLVESFTRHFMVAVDTWQERGFGPVGHEYLARLRPEKGARRDIDETGDLLVRRMGKPEVERRSLQAAVAAPSWRDSATGLPRL